MSARKLRYRVQGERDALAQRMADAIDTWQRAWMLDGVALEHRVVDLDAVRTPTSASWQLFGMDERGAAAVFCRWSEAPQVLAARWLGLPLPGVRPADATREPLVEALARRAGDALLETLALATHCTRTAIAADDDCWRALVRPWSGALAVRSAGRGLTVDWLMSCATVDRLVRRPAPRPRRVRETLVPLSQALVGRKLHATVELERVALGIGELAALRPGDILALGHPLDRPLDVFTADGKAGSPERLFGGFLVAHDGRKSLKLLAESPTNLS